VRGPIGYCPQAPGLFELLTAAVGDVNLNNLTSSTVRNIGTTRIDFFEFELK
jgi:hypothetical protein